MARVVRYRQVPEWLLGFDTETTGLDVANDQAISYGFIAYRFGVPVWREHVFVRPDRPIAPAAERVHGVSMETLDAKLARHEALRVEAGLLYAIGVLRDFHARGAYVVGVNVVRFDLEMLRRSAMSVLNRSLNDADFDLSLLRIIDVRDHDLAIEPSRSERPRRGLTPLCEYYGVAPGNHDALGDARATVEVFKEQVIRNNQGQTSFELGSDAMVSVDAASELPFNAREVLGW